MVVEDFPVVVINDVYGNNRYNQGVEPDVVIDERDCFYLGYTSRTTGKPKGVVISHRSRVLTGLLRLTSIKLMSLMSIW